MSMADKPLRNSQAIEKEVLRVCFYQDCIDKAFKDYLKNFLVVPGAYNIGSRILVIVESDF